ncbi:MAG TPA: type II secretion system protein GspK [Planctomycetota bacterium]|nr:type II secretion system protein GspK [Planctomycetota bacterium]
MNTPHVFPSTNVQGYGDGSAAATLAGYSQWHTNGEQADGGSELAAERFAPLRESFVQAGRLHHDGMKAGRLHYASKGEVESIPPKGGTTNVRAGRLNHGNWPAGRRRYRGSIMVVAMAVTVVLASLLLVYAQQMRVEVQACGNRASQAQATAIARGAIAYVNNQLTQASDPIQLDAQMQCEATPLGDGFFWIVKPNPDDETQYAFGLQDESAKLNLNTATYNMLMALPNMSSDLAAAVLDWVDADDNVNQNGGAENEYYLLLSDPYYCKNSPFETVEEIQFVKGATKDLLWGVDANHNGIVDANENATPDPNANSATGGGSGSIGLQGFNGNARCGIMKYITIYSQVPNVSAKGKARTNIANATTQQIAQLFSGSGMSADRLSQILALARNARPFRSIFDFYYKLGLTMNEFKPLCDKITVNPAKTLKGLVNVNTAPKEVLMALPGMDQAGADTLVAQRAGSSTDLTNVLWVLQALPKGQALAVCNFITVKTQRFSADIIAVSGDGRGFKRLKCVYDVTNSVPTLLYTKDLTSFGWPLDPSILDALKSGQLAAQAQSPTGAPQGGGSTLGGSK